MSSRERKTVVQCDFDNTIAEYDVSFLLLDTFAEEDWRQYLEEYRERRILVGEFSTKSFGMIKTDERTMLDFLFQYGVKIRAGFKELLDYCQRRGFEFVIVSNGLNFYIEAILSDIGINNIEVFAGETELRRQGLEVRYRGPDGSHLQDNFKKAYVESFLSQGYRLVYIGDGTSDCSPASHAHHIFARDDLLAYCQEKKLNCTPFDDLNDVIKGLELLPQR